MTTFRSGDRIKARVTAQGMREGETLTVLVVHRGAWGTVQYEVRGENGSSLLVGNLHVLGELASDGAR